MAPRALSSFELEGVRPEPRKEAGLRLSHSNWKGWRRTIRKILGDAKTGEKVEPSMEMAYSIKAAFTWCAPSSSQQVSGSHSQPSEGGAAGHQRQTLKKDFPAHLAFTYSEIVSERRQRPPNFLRGKWQRDEVSYQGQFSPFSKESWGIACRLSHRCDQTFVVLFLNVNIQHVCQIHPPVVSGFDMTVLSSPYSVRASGGGHERHQPAPQPHPLRAGPGGHHAR